MTVLQFLQMTNFISQGNIRINDTNSNDYHITFTMEFDRVPYNNPIITKYADYIIAQIFIYENEVSLVVERLTK